jgi:hypothetical protein
MRTLICSVADIVPGLALLVGIAPGATALAAVAPFLSPLAVCRM